MIKWLSDNKGQALRLFIALLIGWFLAWAWFDFLPQVEVTAKKEPLYWVAPMDPNFRRDEPGKSPMGMDLIPVYAEDIADEDEAGMVRIQPAVEHNLGLRTASVTKGTLNLNIKTVGYISFDEEQLTHFHSRVDGWVEKLSVTAVGDPVKKGQKLFELYSPELVSAQEEYLAALNSGSAMLRKASASKLAALGVSDGQIQALRRTGKVKQRLDFYADYDAYVAELNIREGMFIKPATTIVSLGSLDSVWILAEIFERQADWVRAGQTVSMAVSSFPDQRWQGVVDYVYPVLDAKTRTIRARIKFDNPDHRLKPNMFAELNVQAQPSGETLSVPRDAVIRDGRMSRVVKALGDGRFKSVRIQTGIESEDAVEVVKGLHAGDRVVTSAHFLLDSESSISADLSRIEGVDQASCDDQLSQQVWVEGEIKSLMPEQRMTSIEHAPVEKWNWPAMTMNFAIAEAVDIESLSTGQTIRFCLQRLDGNQYTITAIDSILDKAPSPATNVIPHGQHGQPTQQESQHD